MAIQRVGLAGLIPVAFQTMSLSNSTAVALNSTIQAGASVLHISVETNAARMRADGTDPTLTTGVVFIEDAAPVEMGYDGGSALKFQRTTGTSVVSVNAWKYAGGDR